MHIQSKYDAWNVIKSLGPGRHTVQVNIASNRLLRAVAWEYSDAYRMAVNGQQRTPVLPAPVLAITGKAPDTLIIAIEPHEWIEWTYRPYASRQQLRQRIDEVRPDAPVTIDGDDRIVQAVRQICVGRNLTVQTTPTGCIVSVDDKKYTLTDVVREALNRAQQDGIATISSTFDQVAYIRSTISRETKLSGVSVTTSWDRGTLTIRRTEPRRIKRPSGLLKALVKAHASGVSRIDLEAEIKEALDKIYGDIL